MSHSYRFGPFQVLPSQRMLSKDGVPLAVGARALDVLLALLERPGQLVGKAELLDIVWTGLVVEEANVQVQVSGLRKLLGPGAIATIPGHGYRFVMPVEGAAGAPWTMSPLANEASAPPAGADPAVAHRMTNVPAAAEDLIGREADVGALCDRLDRARLVSIVGPGGIGKTRVAQEVSRRRAGSRAHGVWCVDLAALSSPVQLPTAIANAARLQLGNDGADAAAHLLCALEPRVLLLVLDNCEHLVAEVSRLVQAMQQAAPGVQVLVTSQELLRLEGELAYHLGPLAMPPAGSTFDAARGFSALQLLEHRVHSADRRFALTPGNFEIAIDLVQRLDGNPLAIEMAAARVPFLGLRTLATRLGERLQLLRSSNRAVVARHQTLRATLDWSHSLLEPREQRVLRRLSMFVGSFRVDIAQRALVDADMDEWFVLDAVSNLVDKSLVQTELLEPPRYRLLETMRVFCAEQLERCGDAAVAEQRHGDAIAGLAHEAEESFWEMSDASWLASYGGDYDDLRAAFDRAVARRDAEVAAASGIALTRLDHLRGVNLPRSDRAQALHALLPIASARARALIWSSLAAHGLIAFDVVSRLEAASQAVAAWRAQAEPMRLHFALGFHAAESARARDFETAELMLAQARALEDPSWPIRRLMWGASATAGVCIHRGDAQGYRAASRLELQLAEQAGADRAAAWARLKLADAALMAGDHAEAVVLGEAAVTELRKLDQPSNLGLALTNLCAALLLGGRAQRAREVAAQALPLMWRNGWAYLLADSLALLAALDARHVEAARLLGFADAWYAGHRDERQPNEAALECAAAGRIEAALGRPRCQQERSDASRLRDEEVEALARSVLGAPG